MHFCIHPETGSSSEANGAENYCALYNFVTKACRNSGPCQVVDLAYKTIILRTSIAGFIISRHSEEVKIGPLFGNQFQIDPSTVPDAFQIEFIDIQNPSDFDGIFSKLLTFYANYVSEETSPNLVRSIYIVSFLRQYISCDCKIVFLIIDIAMPCGRFGRLADLGPRNSFISYIKPKVETSRVKYSSVFEPGLFTSF